MAKLKYVGEGAFLVGVPDRNLSAAEVRRFGHDWLVASGLYKDYSKRPKAVKPEATIQEVDDDRN